MGRITEFIDYINREKEPDPMDKLCLYTHISFTEQIKAARQEHRKNIKKGNPK